MALIDDGIAEIALFGFKGNTVGVDEERNERGQYNKRTRTDGMVAGQFGFKHAGGQIATAALKMPNNKAERAMPSLGASRSGNNNETASAPK